MSLFASLNVARLALAAQQTAIQTTGQNIANATTEGYARQRVQLTPTPADDLLFARLGTGVMVERIERLVDEHLEANLRDTSSDLASLQERTRVYTMIEAVFNDLGGGGLSGALSAFFESLEDLATQPEDPTSRTQVLEQAETLGETFNYLDARVRDLRSALDNDVVAVTRNINRLLTEIASLNKGIVEAEDAGINPGTANDLRTQRDGALLELAQLIDFRVIENDRGAVQVVAGSDVLVFDGRSRLLEARPQSDGDISYHDIRLADDGKLFQPRGGRLNSLLAGRDEITVELRGQLDTIASSIIQEMNRVHGNAEGISRYKSIRASSAVVDRNASLDQAGYPFPIEDGRFSFQVVNEGDGSRETYVIDVDVAGGASLNDVVALINDQVGSDHPEIQARVTVDGYLEMNSTHESVSFTFRDDDSGLLVATGLGSLFEGSSARDFRVSAEVSADPLRVAAGYGAGPGDNRAALDLLALRDTGLIGAASMTFEQFYASMIGEIGVEGAEARELTSNQEAIQLSAKNQRDALSGVNIDEEAINLIQHQRAYQAAARFLNIVDRLLETLINSV